MSIPDRSGRGHWVLSAGKLSLGTLLSRLLGVARDMLRAYLFGTGIAADAFTVAFRLPNMLRALFAEGALSAAYVPVLAETLEKGEGDDWKRFVLNTASVLALTLALVCLLAILLAPLFVPLITPGFAAVPGKTALTVRLTQTLFPYLFFIGLATLAMATLHSLRHFTAPALSASVLNLAMIAAMLWVCPRLGEEPTRRIQGLAWGILAGGLLQLAIQLPPLLRHRILVRFRATLRDPRLWRVAALMLPGVLGMGVAEINAFVDTFLGSLLPAGSVSALEYGNRVMQLPLGVFAVALGTAVLPTLSRHAARGEHRELGEGFDLALRLTLFILLPMTGFLLVAHRPILQLLFERGAFGAQSLALTSRAFVFYSLGLCFYASVKVIVPVFYARQNTRAPVRTAVTAMAANIVLNVILMQWLQLGGLALATALASGLNVALLLRAMKRLYGLSPSPAVARAGLRSLAATLAACAIAMAALLLGARVAPQPPLAARAALLGGAALLAAGGYLAAARLLGSGELAFLLGLRRPRGEGGGRG
ncbi:MAG: murein biosynthesis integral membrane protein MurJ [Candidatus Eisenbacteria bacterium]|uniref:Probable lipid II flippase MurJ n=1 Tax=Eiseniibacteriota bacterium TaxID=2212470 RepID=A0A938BSD5_UNCEI|nr:murein biosynthesis integral membrane protein MurJ [Candidatus Eisenbacteria bacterium]